MNTWSSEMIRMMLSFSAAGARAPPTATARRTERPERRQRSDGLGSWFQDGGDGRRMIAQNCRGPVIWRRPVKQILMVLGVAHGTISLPSVSQPAPSRFGSALAKRSGRPALSGFGIPSSKVTSPEGISARVSAVDRCYRDDRRPPNPRPSVLDLPPGQS